MIARQCFMLLLLVLIPNCDRGKASYEECLELDAKGYPFKAEEACRKAVKADPSSTAGKAAAKWIADRDAADHAAQVASAKVTQAAVDALLTKYRAMTPDGRIAALEQCFDVSPCSDQEQSAIIAAGADTAEQTSLKNIGPKGCKLAMEGGCEFACKVSVGLSSTGGMPDEERSRQVAACQAQCKKKCPAARP